MVKQKRPTPQNPRAVRTLFLSDFHMGYKGFDAWATANFIRSHDAHIIYLVGDIVDGWKMEKRWFWNDACSDVIDALVEKRKTGSKIFYTTGNHDEALRHLHLRPFRYIFGKKFGLKIEESFEHITNNGKKYVVLHGDQFDSWLVTKSSKMADRLYQWMVDRDIVTPKQEETIEDGVKKPWSLRKTIRQLPAKQATKLLNRFTEAAAKRAYTQKSDGIIYGHSHIATYDITDELVIANCGSWTQPPTLAKKHTALIEELNGTLQLVKWPMMRPEEDHASNIRRPLSQISAKHPETREVIKAIHDVWRKDWNLIPGLKRRVDIAIKKKKRPKSFVPFSLF